jgi:hypothetical protein
MGRKISKAERKRRSEFAKKHLVDAAIRWVGQVGFREAVKHLSKHKGITDPIRLAGWLKARAKEMGVLSPKHPYRGRGKKKR